MYYQRHLLFTLLLTLLWQWPLWAEKADLGRAEIQALRQEYRPQREAIDVRRKEELHTLLTRELEEHQRRLQQARIAGNTTRQVDASQAVKLFETALAELETGGSFSFPERVRPALERTIDLCNKALRSEDETRAAAIRRLDGDFAAKLQPLLLEAGELIAEPELLRARWQEVLHYEPPAAAAAAIDDEADAGAGSAAARNLGATDDEVLESRGEAARWVPLARIGVAVNAMEIIPLPLFDLDKRTTRAGDGLQSGAAWQAAVTPFLNLAQPEEQLPALRTRSIPGMFPLEIAEWPSRRNNWRLEVRARARHVTPSRHGILLEVDAAAGGRRLSQGAGQP